MPKKNVSNVIVKNSYGRMGPISRKVHSVCKGSPKSKIFFTEKVKESLPKQYVDTVSSDANGNITTTTPTKTKLNKIYSDDFMDIITDFDNLIERAIINPKKFNKSLLGKLTKPKQTPKFQTHVFGVKELNAVKRKKLKNNGQRKPDQNTVAKISAVDAARAYGLDPDLGWEWTHLVAHRMRGDKGQIMNNLILATKACNTLMMALEDYLEDKAREEKIKVSVAVTADLYELSLDGKNLELTHLGKSIAYKVNYSKQYKIDDQLVDINISTELPFDPLSLFLPPMEFKAYYVARFATIEYSIARKALEELKKKEQDSEQTPCALQNNPSAGLVPSANKEGINRKLDFESVAQQTNVSVDPNNNNAVQVNNSLSQDSDLSSDSSNKPVINEWNKFNNFFSQIDSNDNNVSTLNPTI